MRRTAPSLFDSADFWVSSPREAFSAWLLSSDFSRGRGGKEQALRDSSVRVYRAMFGKFVQQVLTPAGAPARSIAEVGPDDIRHFLDTNNLKKGIRNRYVRLLERTYDRLTEIGVVTENPARGLAQRQPTRSGQHNDKTVWLSQAQQEAVLAALPQGANWKQQRCRAMIAVVLGGGVKVSELVLLSPDNLGKRQEDGSLLLNVYPKGAGRWHRTRVAAFAAAIVAEWAAYRKTLPVPGDLLFPAGAAGGALHPATVYRQVATILGKAGIPDDLIKRRGARTLRNSFAMRELSDGNPSSLVGEYLGHRADRSTRYYTELLPRRRTAR